MFKVTEKGTRTSRTFQTWAGCFEYQRLLASQGRHFTVREKINGKWTLID
jgi:hypothetical protein